MRKLAAIFVSIIYLTLSTGLLVNVHYCQGEIESFSIVSNTSKCCCAAMDSEDGCCHNETLFIQLDVDQQLVSNSAKFIEVFKFIENVDYQEQFHLKTNAEDEANIFKDLSLPPKIAIWKTNCTFLFYG